jgi:8-oxo-dGTP pyrophosphatase MutT (NUDIX family)
MHVTLNRQRRRSCAVLAPVFRDRSDEIRVLLVRRGMRGIHGGQLGFPGGKREPCDRSLLDTALRETEEEVGLERTRIEVLASLGPIDGLTNKLRVHGYLARITPLARWRLAPGEIAGVLTPSVRELADPRSRDKREVSFATWPATRRVECVVLDSDELLWGLTLSLLDAAMGQLLEGAWRL